MKFFEYLKETRGELKHVSWPTRSQAVAFTLVVIGISILVAIFLGVFDYIFTQLISKFLI
ncbi:MAG TPA: preprotein translocase subunit SecE [Candidatus Nanoarchaeia archaeon]|nr:preprotein translocase subunit SecE [Candidatus Nanoarchaeia archaeon]